MESFNRGSDIAATFAFLDHEGNAVTPSSLEWVVTDKDSGTELVRNTDTPTGSSHVVVLSGDSVDMVDETKNSETRLLNWFFQYTATINGQSVTMQGSDEECFKILNTTAEATP